MSTRLKIIDFEIEIKPFLMLSQTIHAKLSCSFFKNLLITFRKLFLKSFIETVSQVEKLRLRVVTYPHKFLGIREIIRWAAYYLWWPNSTKKGAISLTAAFKYVFVQFSGLDGTSSFPVLHCLSHLLPLQNGYIFYAMVKGSQFINRVLFFCNSWILRKKNGFSSRNSDEN